MITRNGALRQAECTYKYSSIAEQANERKGAFEEPRPKWTRTLVLSTNAKFIRRRDFDTAQYIPLLF